MISRKLIKKTSVKDSGTQMRGMDMTRKERARVRRALHALHNLEIMAVTIYRVQITKKGDRFDESLIAAMANEMDHVRDFCAKLYEYRMRPYLFRMVYWKVGLVIGLFARLSGRKGALKTNIRVEEKACRHYKEIIESASWDEATLQILKKDLADEIRHIAVWKEFQGAGK